MTMIRNQRSLAALEAHGSQNRGSSGSLTPGGSSTTKREAARSRSRNDGSPEPREPGTPSSFANSRSGRTASNYHGSQEGVQLPTVEKPSTPPPDIVIHVHDEARKIHKDFTCSQDMLLKHMKYFDSYLPTQGTGESIDISVEEKK